MPSCFATRRAARMPLSEGSIPIGRYRAPGCGNTPSSPVAANFKKHLPFARRRQSQPRNWIIGEGPNQMLIEVTICRRDPVLHKWVNLASRSSTSGRAASALGQPLLTRGRPRRGSARFLAVAKWERLEPHDSDGPAQNITPGSCSSVNLSRGQTSISCRRGESIESVIVIAFLQ